MRPSDAASKSDLTSDNCKEGNDGVQKFQPLNWAVRDSDQGKREFLLEVSRQASTEPQAIKAGHVFTILH